ncbi:uncharacterized protein LOC117915679 [Vitis riparia]|uniref:uncharacterized protein LOC117915679 n=1 Tax=Vitis riparia TaxID=96939 RepID=UPI00155B1FE7|nr:uncharacterized protein LOC117915679 [Vitis riparia]
MRGKKFGDIRIQSPTRNSQQSAKNLRIPLGSRQDLSRQSGNGSGGMGCLDGYLDGDRDGHSQRFSFSQGLPSVESPSMKFQWENLLGQRANLGGNGKPTMVCASGYGADISRMDTENGYTQSCLMGMVPKSVSMVNERTRAFLPCPSDFGPTNISGHIDGRFSSSRGNLNVEFHKENNGRFSSPNMGSHKESVLMGDYACEAKLLGAEVDEDIRIPDSLPVRGLSARKLYEDLRIQGHSLTDKLSDRESYVDIQIQDHRLVHKLSTRESCENIQIQDHLIADKKMARELYKKEEKAMFYPSHRRTYHCCNEEEKSNFYSMDTSHHMMPLAQSEASSSVSKDDFHRPYKNGPTFPSDGFSRETNGEPFSWGGDGRMSGFRSPAKPELRPKRQVQFIPTECKIWDHPCPELWRSERGDLGMVYDDQFYGRMANVWRDCDHQDFVRGSVIDSVVDRIDDTESSYSNYIKDSRLGDHHNSSQESPIHKYLDASKTQYGIRLDGEVLGSRGTCRQDCESMHQEKGYDFERDADPWPYEEKLPALDHDPASGVCPQLSLTLEEPGMHEVSENCLKRKRSMDKKMGNHNPRSKLSSNRKTSTKICNLSNKNEGWASEDIGEIFWSKRLACIHSSRNLSGIQNRLSQPNKPGGKDIKKRSVPGPQNVHISCPVVRKHKSHKFLKRSLDGSHGSLHIEGVPLKTKVSAAINELPEGSEEFKQQVHSMFLKFVKLLNENPAQRRIYTEQGKASNLKCSICGSNSKEFMNTIGLVMHTIMSPKVGLRVQHLGLFKALCLLMGWNSEVTPNKPWAHQVLPAAESLALKEDLIIWPPVVIVHNSSIGNSDPDERMIVTIDMLVTILRDMGFDGGKTKICRGKPANQSIMVVRFNATFSGLQKAEKLHNMYAENQHGRAEFQQINFNNGKTSSCRENRKAQADKVEHVLYGYLGIAGDLDKLDFEAKERSVVKSKKEIWAIADVPLVNE